MDDLEDILDILGYIIVVVFAVLPKIINWLTKRGQQTDPKKKTTEIPPKEAIPRPMPDLEDVLEQVLSGKKDHHGIDLQEFDVLVATVKAQLAKTRDLLDTVKNRLASSPPLVETLEKHCQRPLERHRRRLQELGKQGETPSQEEASELRQSTQLLGARLQVIEAIIDRRIRPATAKTARILDLVAGECLALYITFGSAVRLNYPTRQALTIEGPLGEDFSTPLVGTHLAVTAVLNDAEGHPESWVNIPSDIAIDFVRNVPGLERRIAAGLGLLPPPLSFSHYQNKDSFVLGLVGGWLRRIVGDTATAAQLGPGFAAGIVRWSETGIIAEEVLTARIGGARDMFVPPLHVRVFVACRVLQHLGLLDEGSQRWSQWAAKIGPSQELRLVNQERQVQTIPADDVLRIVQQVVDYLALEPLEQLGGISFLGLPSLRCEPGGVESMKHIAASLKNGQPMDAPAAVIIGATELAIEKNPSFERRISNAALRSFLGEGESPVRAGKLALPVENLAGIFTSSEKLVRAILIGASLAPRAPLRIRRVEHPPRHKS